MVRTHDLLLVGDDNDDRAVMRASCSRCNVHEAADSAQAIDFLLRKDGYAHAPIPDIVLLQDKPACRDLLLQMKSDARLRMIPVIVMLTDDAGWSVDACYDLRANAVVVKPDQPSELREVIQRLEQFWTGRAKLPFDLKKRGTFLAAGAS